MQTLLTPQEVDRFFQWPRGKSAKLAAKGEIPHVRLPDGQIRFDEAELERLLQQSRIQKEGMANAS